MDLKKAVKDKKDDFYELHKRHDTDRDLINLKYKLKDVFELNVPNAISVTLNDPIVFATNVESSLGNSSEQIVVDSNDKNLDTAYIEDAVRDAFIAADDRQIRSGRWQLNPFIDQQMCRRGRGALRPWFRMENGVLIPDIALWDTRFMYYEYGIDGLEWAAYETWRNKDRILEQYPDAKVSGKGGTVLDILGKDHEEVYLNEQKIKEQEHPFGYVPVCIQLVPLGSMLADKDEMKNQGESIFFMIRDLLPEMNRLVSIIQSLNQKALDNALLWKSQAGITAEAPEYQDLTKPGAVTPADMGGGAEPVNYGEIKRSAYLLHSIIEERIQRGSLSSIDLGTLSFELSAVALIEIGEGRDQVFLPRLGARGLLKQQAADMIISQIRSLGESNIELGAMGHKETYNVGKLDGKYDIQFKYFIKSPKVDIARYSMAAAAGDLISNKTKRREVIQLEDPDEEERQLRWEEAERLSPTVKMNRTIRSLLELAKRGDKQAAFEAEMMSAEMGVTLKQVLSGQMPQRPEPPQKPTPLIPAYGRGQGGGLSSPQKSAQLQAEPKEE